MNALPKIWARLKAPPESPHIQSIKAVPRVPMLLRSISTSRGPLAGLYTKWELLLVKVSQLPAKAPLRIYVSNVTCPAPTLLANVVVSSPFTGLALYESLIVYVASVIVSVGEPVWVR